MKILLILGYGWHEMLNGVWWPQYVTNHSVMVRRDIGGGHMIHPNIFVNPLENPSSYVSPFDGYSLEIIRKPDANSVKTDVNSVFPLVIHPCKKSIYIHPNRALADCILS